MLLFVITVSALAVNAQNPSLYKRNPMKEYKLKRLLQDSLQYLKPTLPSKSSVAPTPEAGVVRIPTKGAFIGENEKGDLVYAMQPDQMPCIVPNRKVRLNMPVAGLDNSKTQLLNLPKEAEGQGKVEGEPHK